MYTKIVMLKSALSQYLKKVVFSTKVSKLSLSTLVRSVLCKN